MRENHPYGEFIPKKPRAMIVGSFPIGKFTNPKRKAEIKEHEFDFFFGGEKNLLWKLLGEVFHRSVRSTEEIKELLEAEGLAVGDVILSCRRKDGGASDVQLYDIEWNTNLLQVIEKNEIEKIYFTSRQVEQWFNKIFPRTQSLARVCLISPSAQSVRSLPRRADFLQWLKNNPETPKFQFILNDYRQKFKSKT